MKRALRNIYIIQSARKIPEAKNANIGAKALWSA